MKLNKMFSLSQGDLVSIVGAGGKTSLMFTLAEELRKDYKVLVTTTTKIFVPGKEQYDFMAIGKENFQGIRNCKDKGIYVYGSSINEEGKMVGIDINMLNAQLPSFDLTLAEADGSKGRPIKGWNKSEPVISNKTTKTVGVLSIEVIGKIINEKNVHRINEFLNITNALENGIISMENIIAAIFHTDGLYRCSEGERILFINKVETNEQKILVDELMYYINIKNKHDKLLNKIVYGSLRNREYMKY